MKTLLAILIASSLSAHIGFLKGSSTEGMTKICYYTTHQGTMAISIDAYKLCPVTMDF